MPSLNEIEFHSERILFASALRTASANGADQTNDGWKGVVLVLDITAEDGTVTLDVKIQMKDPISGKYIDIAGAAFAQQSATGTNMLTIYPGIAESANVTVSDVLPKTWRAVATHGGTTSMTYSLSATYIR